jgi:hypothetical protein
MAAQSTPLPCTEAEIALKQQAAMARRAVTLAMQAAELELQLKRHILGDHHADALTVVEEAIGALILWPCRMQRLGRTKHLSRTDRWMFFLFMVGNGASPYQAVQLLLASESVQDGAAVRHLKELVDSLATGGLSKYRTYVMAPHSEWLAIAHVAPYSSQSSICPYARARAALSTHTLQQRRV